MQSYILIIKIIECIIYVKHSYLDAYSFKQINGENGTGSECGNYKYYNKFNKYQTVGGYRTTAANFVHPCGFPMLTLFNGIGFVIL